MAKKKGRPSRNLEVTEAEKQELERLSRKKGIHRRIAFRAIIILLSHQGIPGIEVARRLRTSNFTVCYWRRRFYTQRVSGLYEQTRPGAQRSIRDEQIENVVTLTLESKPKEATHWSTRLMAKQVGLSQSAISRIWRAFGLKPHRADSFSLSTDPLFVEKVRDVVGLYMSPPDNAVVLCVDEKSQIQALNRTQPILPMKPAQEEKRTPDYERHGTTTLFAALDVATGNVMGHCFRRHRAKEFHQFLSRVEKEVPQDLQIHLILDNDATHKTPLIHRWLLRNPRFHLHFIPTHSSWLNLVERWFALLTERQIKRGAHTSVKQLQKAIQNFIDLNNESPRPFVWIKSAEEVLDKVARFALRQLQAHKPSIYEKFNDSGH